MIRFHDIALVVILAASGGLRGAEPASWELSPYQVQLVMAVDRAASLSPQVADDLPADLATRLAAEAGGAWRITAQAAPAELRYSLLTNLAAVATAELPEATRAADKVILVAITRQPGRYQVQARELDTATGLWNAVVTSDVAQADQLLPAAQRAVLAAFAPLARIESVDAGVATLKLRAGALLRHDRSPSVVAGAIFRPVVLKSADGRIQSESGEQIPWTVLTATSASGSTLSCRIDTGLAGDAFPAYHPARPRWALGVAVPTGSTRLRLVSASDANVPLEGCEVLSQAGDLPAGATESARIGVSDASGLVTIPAGNSSVRILQIRQGDYVLARVPLIPGLAEEVALALPDDRQRLEVELVLAEIEDEVLDLAARREALITRAKAALKAGEVSAGGKLKDQLAALPGPDSLSSRLDQAASALKSASQPAQAALQPKLDALRKAVEQLAAQKPLDRLAEPKTDEAKPESSSAGGGSKKS